jgi:hypothetical protein
MTETSTVLSIIGLVGGGTILARPSILATVAHLFLPGWLVLGIRHLALPAVVAPAVFAPVVQGNPIDPSSLAMGAGLILIGYLWRKMVFAFVSALAILYFVPQMFAT